MTNFKDLKKGDKVYQIVYWEHSLRSTERRLIQRTIIKVTGRKAMCYGGYDFVTETTFDREWFPSKLEAYKDTLDKEEYEFEKTERVYQRIKREVEYLKGKIREEQRLIK